MADVFISYASEDRERVAKLAAALQQRGLSVWWDRQLAAGQDYASVIERQLDGAEAVIVVWSAASVGSSFVRDEAGRARDRVRLVPVLFDNVEIPIGFGTIHAEDFTRWSGAVNAPQMQALDESVRAKVMGRDPDGDLIARKRRSAMTNIRIVTLLTVVFLIFGIGVFGRDLLNPPPPDPRVALLELLDQGKLTPDQAIQLSHMLAPTAAGADIVPAEGATTANAPAFNEADVLQASFAEAAARLAQNAAAPNHIRAAIGQMAAPDTRDAAMQTMWRYAEGEADEETKAVIYQLCAAVAEAHDDPRAERAIERAATLAPDNALNWKMAQLLYARSEKPAQAAAAQAVDEGLAAKAGGDLATAEARFQSALPALTNAPTRAFVAGELGDLAAQRSDWAAAGARFAAAYRARADAAAEAPGPRASELLSAAALRYVGALDLSGRTQEACTQLQRAQIDYDVGAPEGDLVQRCAAQFNVTLRAG